MVHGPLSIGLFRPLVVVPTSIRGLLTDVQFRGMLLHEFAHIARRDHLIGLLQRLAMIVFWWNPLVHRVSERISSIREQICDDLATSRIESPDSYADMLLDLAERVGVLSLPATIGIFENPGREFRTRIVRLLDSRRPIVTTLDRRMKFVCVLLFVTMIGVILGTAIHVKTAEAAARPDDLFGKPSQTAASNRNASSDPVARKRKEGATDNAAGPPIKWPPFVRGVIKNPDGKPLVGAKVRFDVEKIHQYPTGRWEETLHTATLTTGPNGDYRFDTSQLPATTHRPFCIHICSTADGYSDAKTWNWYNYKDKSVGENFRDLKMQSGRVIRGRCVDRNGKPIEAAVVKIAGDNGPDNWAWDPRATDREGKFEIRLPKNSTRAFAIWVAHPKWAPQYAAIPKDGTELADIRLQEGRR